MDILSSFLDIYAGSLKVLIDLHTGLNAIKRQFSVLIFLV